MEISLASFKARFTYDPQKDLLGKGGYSEVYKAYDNDYKTDVALKIYQGDYSSQYNLLNEIRKYRRLQHPHVIQHLEAFEVNTGSQDLHGNPIKYQVGILEYANAGTLADLIKQGQLTGSTNAAKLESIAKDIISGLEYLHSQNIIHRDLKPSNILLFKQGEKLIPKICDFGIAKVMDNATAVSTQLVGTVEYMAPEYFRTDLGDIGKASDLWSLGVILLEAASGQHPFGKASEGYSNGQIINNILSREKINLDVIQDASILEIVRGLLNPNPKDRHCENIGTERKDQNEPIQNPADSNSKPLVDSNNRVWNAMKHLFYSFIDFKFTDGGWKKILLREFCLLSFVILGACLLPWHHYEISYKLDNKYETFYVKDPTFFILPYGAVDCSRMHDLSCFGHVFDDNEVFSKFFLILLIIYVLIQVRIIFYWKEKGYIKNLISKWSFFECNKGKWRSVVAKEIVYIFFLVLTTMLIGSIVAISSYFYSYRQTQLQKADLFSAFWKKDSLQEIYERPQSLTRAYFGWHSNDNKREEYTDLGIVYATLIEKGIDEDKLPYGINSYMSYASFWNTIFEKINLKDDSWINKMENAIRSVGGQGWQNYELITNFNSINNITIQNTPLKTTDPYFMSKLLYPYSFTSREFIDDIKSHIDNNEWLLWFYNYRILKNDDFLSYIKSKGITDKFAFRTYVNTKLYVSEHPYEDYNDALMRYKVKAIEFDLLRYNLMFLKIFNEDIEVEFPIVMLMIGSVFLILLYPLRLTIIVFKWIAVNSK